MSEIVLIVDDSLTVRMDLAEAFTVAGFQSMPCATVSEARAVLARGPVSIAVLDVLLPDGDGVDFLKELRSSSSGATTVVLMLSTEAEVKDRIRGLQTGADEYVGKPYETGYVIAKARELLRARCPLPVVDKTTVLVIDDSLTLREELRVAFVAVGYAVLVAESGEEGLRVAADRRPDAVVVDGMLPGIDGATVIRRFRLDAALRSIPCVLLTGSEEQGDELRALDAGADAFVRKDEPVDVICARLAAVLRHRGITVVGDTASLLGPKRILAVDDSATYLHALAATLRGEGYDVVLARAGEEAIELLSIQSVDCILLDLLMPGMGGQEACRRIKSAPIVRDIPLIMLTALEDRVAMIEGLGAGADDYISKSSEFEVLKARVRAQLRRKQFEDENRHIREQLLQKEIEATEARAAKKLVETRAILVEELERKNKELEAFSYSVSHDLRAPLRGIDGFSQILLEDYAEKLDPAGQGHLSRIRAAAARMSRLIDDMLHLSRVSRAELRRERSDLSAIARLIVTDLQRREPERMVEIDIQEGLIVDADSSLMTIVLDNLLGNAWKFTGKKPGARITFGVRQVPRGQAYAVHDNGAGFDMTYAERLFHPFQRLHSEADFSGTGVGLATVQRVVDRHGGVVWAEGAVDQGATFFFTMGSGSGDRLMHGLGGSAV